jgi:hypothetical protein
MPSFVLKSYKGGQSDYDNKGLPGAFKSGSYNLDIRKKVDSLSCAQALADVGNPVIIVDLIRMLVPSTDGNCYGFGSTGKIYKITSSNVVSVVYTDADGAITGAAEFSCSNGKKYMFWATATKLKCKEIPGNAAWTDANADVVVGATTYTYPKTDLTSSTNHMMTQAVGSLQIANEDYLAMVGYDGSYTNEALNLYPRNYAKVVMEKGRYVMVGAPRDDSSSESELFIWDTVALDYNDNKCIKGGAVNAMIETEAPLAQLGINGGIYYADFQNVLPVCQITGGGYCNPYGVTNDDGVALFGIYGNSENLNGIYSYGRKTLNDNRTLNLEYYIGACTEIGSIAKVGTRILVAYRNGSSYYLKRVDTASKATAYYYSLDLEGRVKAKLDDKPVWSFITLFMKPLPASCTVEVYYKLDKAGSFIQANMQDDVTSSIVTGLQESVFLVNEQAETLEIEVKLTPSVNTTPEIFRVECFFG